MQYKDRYKLIIISHRGQEQYNITLIGYKGSPPYVQRQTDTILRSYRDFVRAYIDDILAFSYILPEHLGHLRKLFSLFRDRGVSLAPKKTFLGYLLVILLGHRINTLGISISNKKIAVIKALVFLYTLRKLKTFLGLTGWLRTSIPRYI